ncbi:MAG: hypothetical protein Q8N54_11790 [Sulfurimicrobium sp.]|jgi:hypothetical protein|nr:hypothetical protein [Sulfurimicrobium sp.]MDO9191176.1 hypothetical protein [Sulfurimicrobium sp.]MDP1705136.1 hypothetical protein [Sulfurimicrobium sp.]MDP2197411.1 hypothetical protein [Sulfurimicrobium sp.]MDP2963432.1 hypothetical protein [Sulfurimicrobium sp.]
MPEAIAACGNGGKESAKSNQSDFAKQNMDKPQGQCKTSGVQVLPFASPLFLM